MAKRRKCIGAWALVAIWMAVIWGLSSVPGSALPSSRDMMSVVAHIVEYGVLGYLLARAFFVQGMRQKERWTLAVIGAVIFGIIDEIHQAFVPGREASVADIAVDAASAIGGALLQVAFFPGIRRKRKDGV